LATQFELIRQAADAYLASGKADRTISAKQVWDVLSDAGGDNAPIIISLRTSIDYERAHVCEATNVPWGPDFIDEWYSRNIPLSRQVILYCYNGHIAGAAAALLNLLGYDAVNMQWGYTSWMWCKQKAPGEFVSAKGRGLAMNYPVETSVNTSDKTYPFPEVNNNVSGNGREIIKVAAAGWCRSKVLAPKFDEGPQYRTDYPFITPKSLFAWLHNEDPDDQPLVLSVRSPQQYAAGHIKGSINIPLAQLSRKESLSKLPTDRTIVVVSNDGMSGSQAMAILNIMGYDARNLLFGMTGWTENDSVAPGRFIRYHPGTHDYKDIMDYAFCTGSDPGSYFKPTFQQCMDSF